MSLVKLEDGATPSQYAACIDNRLQLGSGFREVCRFHLNGVWNNQHLFSLECSTGKPTSLTALA